MHNTEILLDEALKQVRELRALYRSALGLAGTLDVDSLLEQVASDIADNTSLKRIAILLHREDENALETHFASGFNGDPILRKLPVDQIEGPLKELIWQGDPINVVQAPSDGRDEPERLFIDAFPVSDRPKRHPVHLFLRGKKEMLPKQLWPGIELEEKTRPHPSDSYSNGSLALFSGFSTSFLLLPLKENQIFLGLVIADAGRDNTPVPYEDARLAAAIVRHASRPIILAKQQQEMLRKIEEQNWKLKEAKKELAQTLEQTEHLKSFYESIIQNLKSGLITVGQKMEITHVNKSAEEILGYSKEELLGQSIRTILPEPDQARRCIFREQVEALDLDTGHISQIELVAKDGEHIPVETCFSVITDSFEEIKGLSCIFRDITEERLQEQHMARIERLASLGELAAGVAHEIKNPLAGINGALQVLAQAFPRQSNEREIFTEILKQIKRLDQVVHQLLEFARPKKPDFKSINLIEIINRCLFLVGNRIAEGRIKTKISLDSDHPPLKGDPNLLQQAILNILLNALDAMEPGGTLEIHTCWMDKANSCAKFKCLSPINRTFHSGIRILIKDTGKGIPQEKLDTIFNPFFTTKQKGTGLGLAITHRIIEQHQGSIYVDSNPGKGTIFIINLPSKQIEISEE